MKCDRARRGIQTAYPVADARRDAMVRRAQLGGRLVAMVNPGCVVPMVAVAPVFSGMAPVAEECFVVAPLVQVPATMQLAPVAMVSMSCRGERIGKHGQEAG
ncbi:MAG: hypothetical protein KGR26_04185 [Cyanobacteria bacterium REEB65]|nr:hypothetical protein [Cyanobacteria bacterium REEB65]